MADTESKAAEQGCLIDPTWPFWIAYVTGSLSLAGLVNQWVLLGSFGISLSDYADLDDFLVAAINLMSPYVLFPLLFILVPVLTLFVWYQVSDWRSSRQMNFYMRLIVFFLPAFLGWGAAMVAVNEAKNLNACIVDVQLKQPGPNFKYRKPKSDDSESDFPPSFLFYLTGLNSMMFLYEVPYIGSVTTDRRSSTFLFRNTDEDQAARFVHAIPTAAIAQVIFLRCPDTSWASTVQSYRDALFSDVPDEIPIPNP